MEELVELIQQDMDSLALSLVSKKFTSLDEIARWQGVHEGMGKVKNMLTGMINSRSEE